MEILNIFLFTISILTAAALVVVGLYTLYFFVGFLKATGGNIGDDCATGSYDDVNLSESAQNKLDKNKKLVL